MKAHVRLALAGLILAAAVPARAGEVKVTFSDGRVTVVATDASPRQIMTEWAKVGQVRITNLERLSGAPVTLLLNDVPESQALETLLRGSAGYVAAPRGIQAVSLTASRFDRILLMPLAAPAVQPAITASQPTPAMPVNRGRPTLPSFDPDDEDPPPGPVREGTRQQSMPPGMMMPGQTITPGQVMMPGQMTTPASPYQPSPFPGGGAMPPVQGGGSPLIPTYSTPQAPGATGTAFPGMTTTPMPINGRVYPTPGSPGMPGEAQTPPGTAGAVTGATTPGQVTPPGPIKK